MDLIQVPERHILILRIEFSKVLKEALIAKINGVNM